MSKEEDKTKHNTRMHRAWRAIKKQLNIIKAHKNFGAASKRIDEAQPHRYVVMIRDLGAKRRPAFLIGFGSGLIFFLLCWILHRREALLRKNLALKTSAA